MREVYDYRLGPTIYEAKVIRVKDIIPLIVDYNVRVLKLANLSKNRLWDIIESFDEEIMNSRVADISIDFDSHVPWVELIIE